MFDFGNKRMGFPRSAEMDHGRCDADSHLDIKNMNATSKQSQAPTLTIKINAAHRSSARTVIFGTLTLAFSAIFLLTFVSARKRRREGETYEVTT